MPFITKGKMERYIDPKIKLKYRLIGYKLFDYNKNYAVVDKNKTYYLYNNKTGFIGDTAYKLLILNDNFIYGISTNLTYLKIAKYYLAVPHGEDEPENILEELILSKLVKAMDNDYYCNITVAMKYNYESSPIVLLKLWGYIDHIYVLIDKNKNYVAFKHKNQQLELHKSDNKNILRDWATKDDIIIVENDLTLKRSNILNKKFDILNTGNLSN